MSLNDIATTDSYDFEVENQELVNELDIVDAEVHTTENVNDLIPLVDDERLRRQDEAGWVLETSANGPFATIPWNFYNNHSGGERGGRPLLTQPLKSIEDFERQQDDIRADKVLINSLQAINSSEIRDTRKQVEYLRAANRFQNNLAVDGEKYFTAVTINPDHPRESVEEIDKYADRDAVVFVMSPSVTERPLGNKRYHPVLEAVEQHDLPLVMHGQATSNSAPRDFLKMDRYFEQRTLGQFMPHVRNAVSFIGEEIPERFDLDLVFIEHCISWAPMLMNRMDREFDIRGFDSPGLTRKPSEYLREFYYGTQPLEKPHNPQYLGTMLEMMGLEDQIIYTSDYPHPDGDHIGMIADHPGLTREQKKKILQDNSERLFDL